MSRKKSVKFYHDFNLKINFFYINLQEINFSWRRLLFKFLSFGSCVYNMSEGRKGEEKKNFSNKKIEGKEKNER